LLIRSPRQSGCRQTRGSGNRGLPVDRRKRRRLLAEKSSTVLIITRASVQLGLSGGLPGRDLLTSANTDFACTMTKVGKSDGEGTFAGMRGNDEVAPIPAIRASGREPSNSTQRGHKPYPPSLRRDIISASED